MKFKFLKAALTSVMLFVSMGANAGFIKNGLEWLDLDVTVGKSVDQVYASVLSQEIYNEYRYATKTEVDAFWDDYFLPTFHSLTDNEWHLTEGYADSSYDNFLINAWRRDWATPIEALAVEGTYYYDKSYIGRYIFDDGRYSTLSQAYISNVRGLQGWEAYNKTNYGSYIHVRGATAIQGNWQSDRQNNHMLVKNVSVPEPSTLAIFALGLMGLASRRFKKQ